MNEQKFIKKSITKMLLTGRGDKTQTKANMPEVIRYIGYWIGRIGFYGQKAKNGYTPEEVADLMEKFNQGFLEGYSVPL
jgi:hypothetical protein